MGASPPAGVYNAFTSTSIDDQGRTRKGSWQQCWSGQKWFGLDPRIDEIHFDDMAIGLSREGRYANQTREPYFVAEHSVIVSLYAEKFARERWEFVHGREEIALLCARQGLIHDAAEAWLGDVARPIKRQPEMAGYCEAEVRLQKLVFKRFGVRPTGFSNAIIDEIDTRIVLDEVEALMIDPDMWARANRYPDYEPLGAEIAALTHKQALDAFCQRFSELWPDWKP